MPFYPINSDETWMIDPPKTSTPMSFAMQSQMAARAAMEKLRKKNSRLGRASTILTSPLGLPGGGIPTQQKTLLGQ